MEENVIRLPELDPGEHAQAHGAERRRCKRVTLAYPLEVSGSDHVGQSFRDLTVTTDVSDQGCRFDLLRELRTGDLVTIQIVWKISERSDDGRRLQCGIAWVAPSRWGWSVGVIIHMQENFWHMTFPRQGLLPNSRQS